MADVCAAPAAEDCLAALAAERGGICYDSPCPSSSSTSLADFKEVKLLGEGAYSAVYKVIRIADGETYALKKVKLPSLSDKEKQNALNEVRLVASVRHENVISYKEAFFDDKTRCLCIVTECADGGDLMAQIVQNQKKKRFLPERDAWRYLIGLCHGLKALHQMRILHRDMKPANVFLSGSGVAKLGDFNVSTVNKRGLCMTQTGTPYYASPEVWRDMPYDSKSDMWSLGCVLYEVLALHPPFQAKDMEGLYRTVLKGKYPRIPDCYSKELSEVLTVLLQVNPRHRPSAEQLLQLPMVRQKAQALGVSLVIEGSHPVESELMQTIKVPRNIVNLSSCLPRPQYDLANLAAKLAPGTVSVASERLDKIIKGDASPVTPAPPTPSQEGGDALDAYMRQADTASQQAPALALQQQKAQNLRPLLEPPRELHESRSVASLHPLPRSHSTGRGRQVSGHSPLPPPPSGGPGTAAVQPPLSKQPRQRRLLLPEMLLGKAGQNRNVPTPGPANPRGQLPRSQGTPSRLATGSSRRYGSEATLPTKASPQLRLPRILSSPNMLLK
eukprot:TRINITY_DN8852_c0_g1_i1.p1 TRINITY_DN8852_c0_g1~~TRINITY_DN8852_c0_g1_i1.p1  ORF type:complete len:557 (+),score=113.51 TRINITY_DN8852_c0_g1_i1:149-1819(+)